DGQRAAIARRSGGLAGGCRIYRQADRTGHARPPYRPLADEKPARRTVWLHVLRLGSRGADADEGRYVALSAWGWPAVRDEAHLRAAQRTANRPAACADAARRGAILPDEEQRVGRDVGRQPLHLPRHGHIAGIGQLLH